MSLYQWARNIDFKMSTTRFHPFLDQFEFLEGVFKAVDDKFIFLLEKGNEVLQFLEIMTPTPYKEEVAKMGGYITKFSVCSTNSLLKTSII